MKSRLLVLGASRYQIPVIETALTMGCEVVTTDNVPGNPGHKLAQFNFSVDTTDREGVLDLALRMGIDGIVASCTDVAVPTAAFVAERMGFPGPSFEAAQMLCDKAAFRQWQHQQHLPAPDWHSLQRDAVWNQQAWGGTEWIVKPTRSSGSKGVRRIRGKQDFDLFFPEAIRVSLASEAVLERFLPGRQGTAEGLIVGGEIVFMAATNRMTAPSPFVATCGHFLPGDWSASECRQIRDALAQIVRGAGLADCLFDADFVLSGENVCILEFTPRQGGNSLNRLLGASHGVNLCEWAVNLALGRPVDASCVRLIQSAAVLILGMESAGKLEYDESGFQSLKAESWVAGLEMDYERGAELPVFADGTARLGEALVVSGERDELALRCRALLEKLNIRNASHAG